MEDCELFEFNMARVAGGLLGVNHESGAIVALVLLNDSRWQLFHSS
jgi:hypothetical protein